MGPLKNCIFNICFRELKRLLNFSQFGDVIFQRGSPPAPNEFGEAGGQQDKLALLNQKEMMSLKKTYCLHALKRWLTFMHTTLPCLNGIIMMARLCMEKVRSARITTICSGEEFFVCCDVDPMNRIVYSFSVDATRCLARCFHLDQTFLI